MLYVRADLIIAGVVREITITENGKQNVNTKTEVWPDARHRKGCVHKHSGFVFVFILDKPYTNHQTDISTSKCNFFPIYSSSIANCFSTVLFVSEI